MDDAGDFSALFPRVTGSSNDLDQSGHYPIVLFKNTTLTGLSKDGDSFLKLSQTRSAL